MSDQDRGGYANGPVISIAPPPRLQVKESPALPPRPTWQELAYGYATIAGENHTRWASVYGELDEMRAGIILLDTRVANAVEHFREQAREAIAHVAEPMIRAIVEEVVSREGMATREAIVNQPRRRLPSLAQYNPDHTPGHGIRLDQQAWDDLREHVDALQAEREAEKKARHDEEMKRRGAEEYAERIAADAKLAAAANALTIRRIKAIVPIIVAVLAAIEGVLRFLVH